MFTLFTHRDTHSVYLKRPALLVLHNRAQAVAGVQRINGSVDLLDTLRR